jgi:hemoglobin/transferrin/lactoferrin receptor protein
MTIALPLFGLSLVALQDPAPVPAPRADDVPETVVTPTGAPRLATDSPQSVSIIDEQELARRSYRTVPQALRHQPGVLVQETSHGQGSPFIRGFTGFRTVLLVDGIRLNNSTFREGPNQYWNTVDAWSLERMELLRGPSSALYGSDAIGGTLQVFTRSPFAVDGSPAARIGYRVASAEESHVGRVEASSVQGGLGVVVGATYKEFGDIRGGEEIGEQPNTGYDEIDGDAKVEQWFEGNTRLVLAYQKVVQNDVPRTHATIFAQSFEGSTVGTDRRRDLDQERDLLYAQLESEPLGELVDRVTFSASWQRQQELEDRIRSNLARSLNGVDVDTLGLFAHFESDAPTGRWTFGADWYRDYVDSFSSSNPIQGPVADDATYDLIGLFAQDEIDVTDRLVLTAGARASYAAADADRVRDPVTTNQIAVDEDWSALVGSLRFDYELSGEELGLFGGVSQGFRAPNLSDLTRFDSARTNEFEIPALGLDPEYYLTYELGTRLSTPETKGEIAVFYTDIDDQIQRFPTGNVNGTGEFEITRDNIGDGWVYGIEFAGSQALGAGFSVLANATFQEGRVTTYPTSAQILTEEPVSRLMPLTGMLGLRWDEEAGRFWAELLGTAAADADQLSTSDQLDTQRIPPGGTPGFVVVHARAGWRVSDATDIMFAVENLTDEDYRFHGSGTNQPGLNVVLGVSVTL